MPQFCILFYANYTILATQRGRPWPNAPPLNTPLILVMTEASTINLEYFDLEHLLVANTLKNQAYSTYKYKLVLIYHN